MQPTITMRDFFNLPEVREAQETQKRNPFGSPEHRAAFEQIKEIARTYGATEFIGDYED